MGSQPILVGDELRRAREAAGLEIADVAAHLRIRSNFLAALEEGRPDALPGITYAIGYVRTYAGFLGLDPETSVRRFKEEAAGLNSRTELVFPSPAPEGRVPGVAVMLIALLLAGGAYGGWYWVSERDGSLHDLVPLVPERLAQLIEGEAPSLPSPDRTPVSGVSKSTPALGTAGTYADANPKGMVLPSSRSNDAVAPSAAAPSPAAPQTSAAAVATLAPSAVPAPATSGQETAAPAISAPLTGPVVTAATPVSPNPASAASEPASPQAPVQAAPSQTAPSQTAPSQAPSSQAVSSQTQTAPVQAASSPSVAARPDTDTSTAARPTPLPPSTTFATVKPNAGTTSWTAAPQPTAAPVPSDTPSVAADDTPDVTAPPVPATVDRQVGLVPTDVPPAPRAVEQDVPAAPRIAGLIGASEAAVPSDRTTAGTIDRIMIRATGDSWVQVRDAEGTALFTRVLRDGDIYRVPSKAGLRLATGNAGALDILVDGVPAPRLGGFGDVVRNITLDPARLAAGTAASAAR